MGGADRITTSRSENIVNRGVESVSGRAGVGAQDAPKAWGVGHSCSPDVRDWLLDGPA